MRKAKGRCGVHRSESCPFPSVPPSLQPPRPSSFRTHGPLRLFPANPSDPQRLPPLAAHGHSFPFAASSPSVRSVSPLSDKALPHLGAPRPCATLPAPLQPDSISSPPPTFRDAGGGRAGVPRRAGGGARGNREPSKEHLAHGLPGTWARARAPHPAAPCCSNRHNPAPARDHPPPLGPARSARPFPGRHRSGPQPAVRPAHRGGLASRSSRAGSPAQAAPRSAPGRGT